MKIKVVKIFTDYADEKEKKFRIFLMNYII
jgi:hypothetical protein